MNQFILALSLLIFVCGCQPSQNSNREIIESSTLQSESGLISTPDTGASSSTGSDATITLTIKTNSSVIRSESVVLSSGVQGFSLLTTSCPNINNSRTCTVRVKFTVGSKENGTYSDNLLIGDLSVPLSLVLNKPIPVNDITGLIVLENSTEISSLNFGNLSGNNSVVKTLIIKDPSKKVKETLMISSSTSDFSVFTTSCAAALINSSAGCTVRIQLSSAGKPLGSLNSNLSIGEKVFLMSANIQGVAANNPILQLLIDDTEVSAKDFGTVSLGNKSSVIIKIKNSGNSSSVGNSLVVSGQAFSVTGSSCSSVVAAGATCQLTLNLNAINLSGLQTGSLSYGGKTLALQAIINGSCPIDKHSENGLCVSNIQTENIYQGTRTRNYISSAWGNWVYSCNPGYSSDGNSCLANSIACEIFELPSNTVAGEKIFNGSSYGSCLATTCTHGHFPTTGICLEAPIGNYADGLVNASCPTNSSTISTGSENINSCLALAGYFKDTDLVIKVVGEGYFSANLKNERDTCLKPNLVVALNHDGYMTNSSQADCDNHISAITACEPGSYIKNMGDKYCSIVEIGSYADGFSTLKTQCPVNLTTATSGSTQLNDCFATPGYRLDNNAAVACSNGFYQDLAGQVTCKSCSAPSIINAVEYTFLNNFATTTNNCASEIYRCKPAFTPSSDKTSCVSGVVINSLDPAITNPFSVIKHSPELDKVLFVSSSITGYSGTNIYSSDGTVEGTTLITGGDAVPNQINSIVGVLDDKKIIYGTQDGRLFATDGVNSYQIKGSTNPSYGGNNLFSLKDGTNRALFTSGIPSTGFELWITDGTALNTFMLKELNPGTANSSPSNYVRLPSGMIVFTANTAATGQEFWTTDGTANGTVLLADLYPGTTGSNTYGAMSILGNSKFLAEMSVGTTYGTELYIFDSIALTATLLKDIRPGSSSSMGAGPPAFIANNGTGTTFFAADDGTNGKELWATDGTPENTRLVKNIATGSAASVTGFNGGIGINGKVVFFATTSASGMEPWVSDGTDLGTFMLGNLNSGTASSAPQTGAGAQNGYTALLPDGRVILYLHTPNASLFITDGTVAGTIKIHDFGSGSTANSGIFVVNNKLWGTISNSIIGREMFYLDLDSLDGIAEN